MHQMVSACDIGWAPVSLGQPWALWDNFPSKTREMRQSERNPFGPLFLEIPVCMRTRSPFV
jgi:hypothetical protein